MNVQRSSNFVLNTLETMVSAGSNIVMNTLTGIVINRGLGPEGKGIYAGVVTWSTTLVWIFNTSFYQVTVYYFRKMPDKMSTVFATLISMSFVLGLIAALAAEFLICPILAQRYHFHNLIVVRCLFAIIPLSTIVQVVNGGLNGLLKFRFTNTVQILQPLTLLNHLDCTNLSNSMTATTCIAGTTAVAAVYGIIAVIYAGVWGFFSSKPDIRLIWPALSYGLKGSRGNDCRIVSGNFTPVLLSIMLYHQFFLGTIRRLRVLLAP